MLYNFDFIQRVEYVDTDKMGIMHNSNYFRFFEIGRNELMRELGVRYIEVESRGIIMPIIEQYCKYIKPAFYDDNLIIRTSIDKIPRSSIVFNYIILRQKGDRSLEEICKGYNILAFLDKESKKPRRCPEWIIEFLNKKIVN